MHKIVRILMMFGLLCGFLGVTQASEIEADKYVVKSGDWLSTIAKANGTTWQKLAKDNSIANPHLIFPGQVIVIKKSDVITAKPAIVTKPTNQTPHAEVACTQSETPTQVGIASWYGHPYHGRESASGERYDMNTLTVAHLTLPFGTIVCLTEKRSGKSVIAKVNDRGPYVPPRILDVSKRIAEHLGLIGPGLGMVSISVIEKPKGKWVRPKYVATSTVRKDLVSTQTSVVIDRVATLRVASTPESSPGIINREQMETSETQDHRREIRAFLHETIGPPYDTRLIENAMMGNEKKSQAIATFLSRD